MLRGIARREPAHGLERHRGDGPKVQKSAFPVRFRGFSTQADCDAPRSSAVPRFRGCFLLSVYLVSRPPPPGWREAPPRPAGRPAFSAHRTESPLLALRFRGMALKPAEHARAGRSRRPEARAADQGGGYRAAHGDGGVTMLIPPIAHIAAIELTDANAALVKWGHRMGACKRPNGNIWAHGLFAHGELVAVTISAALIRETCAGLTRAQAVELARLCASRPGLCRVMLRLWREFVYPAHCQRHGYEWAVSYQDESLHIGDTYRFDGWVRLREHARSGPDSRTGRPGRTKTIWGWHEDGGVRSAAKLVA
jgi:hypothetical protein